MKSQNSMAIPKKCWVFVKKLRICMTNSYIWLYSFLGLLYFVISKPFMVVYVLYMNKCLLWKCPPQLLRQTYATVCTLGIIGTAFALKLLLYCTPLTVNFKTISKLYIMWVIRYPRYYYSVDAIIVLDV